MRGGRDKAVRVAEWQPGSLACAEMRGWEEKLGGGVGGVIG